MHANLFAFTARHEYKGEPYCDFILGCFEMNGVFSERKKNYKPYTREAINTKFVVSL